MAVVIVFFSGSGDGGSSKSNSIYNSGGSSVSNSIDSSGSFGGGGASSLSSKISHKQSNVNDIQHNTQVRMEARGSVSPLTITAMYFGILLTLLSTSQLPQGKADLYF